MLIRHFGASYPEAALRMDYQQLLASADLVQDIPDPHAFLSDPNNWVPYTDLPGLNWSSGSVKLARTKRARWDAFAIRPRRSFSIFGRWRLNRAKA